MKTTIAWAVLTACAVVVTARELDYARMAECIAIVESGKNPGLVGDDGRAVGSHQMWACAVQAVDDLGYEFLLVDRKDYAKSSIMCTLLLREFHRRHPKEDEIRLMCRWRNPNGPAKGWYRQKLIAQWRALHPYTAQGYARNKTQGTRR